jgi:hypothetical protein
MEETSRQKRKRAILSSMGILKSTPAEEWVEVKLDLEDARAENARLADYEVALKSLLTELWEGVRLHGLQAPTKGRDGERLIHAYCGGIAKLRVKNERLVELLKRTLEWLPKLSVVEVINNRRKKSAEIEVLMAEVKKEIE